MKYLYHSVQTITEIFKFNLSSKWQNCVLLFAGVLFLNLGNAQTLSSDYQFATSSTAYAPLVGATTLIAGTNGGTGTFNDAATAGPTNIGFSFRFNCLSYTQFSVTPNGYLKLGGGAITTNFNNDLATAGNYPIIAPWWDHQHLYNNGGAANGCNFDPLVGVLYQLNGTAPNRVLTIEFNTQVTDNSNNFWWTGCGLTMNRYQVRLYEGTNRIQFHYGSLWASSGQPTSATIGIANAGSNFLSVTPTGGTGTVSSVTSNNTIAAHIALIPSNTVYNFTPCYFNLIGNAVDAPASMAPGDILLSNITNACGSNTVYSPFTVNFPAGSCPSHNYTLSITGSSATEYQFTATNNQTQAGTLAAGATITPSIRFIPNGVGVRSAFLTFTDNSTGCSTLYNLAANASTPTAVATPSTQTSCSGDPIATIVLTGTGTSYNWVRDNTATVTGIAASGTGNISGTLTNTTNAPITVTFTITPMSGSCAGTPITATVVVNPKPYAAASPTSQTSCSNSPITPIVLTSVFPNNLVVGLNFSTTWADEITLQLVDASSVTVLSAGPFGLNSTYTSPAIPAVNGPYTFNIQAGCGACDNYGAFTVNCNASTIASGCIRAAGGPACANTGSFSVPGLNCSGAGVSGVVFNWVRDNPGVIGMPNSGTGSTISGTLINPTTSPIVVTFTITPSYTNAGVTCTGTPITATVTVNPLPAATISYAGSPYCSNAGTATVTRTGTAGGTYSAVPAGLTLNAATGAITLGTSTPGTYTVTYTIAASGPCPAVSTSTTITITALPAATISYAGSPYCSTDLTAPVTRIGTAGGTYSSTAGLTINAATGTVIPATSTPGTYTVTYTMAAGGGCPAVTATTTITITQAPNMIILYLGTPYCSNAGIATVSRFGTAGGTYSAAPAGLSINAATGAVTLGTSTPGTYTVTYTIAPSGGCGTTITTTTITITAAPSATISYAGTPYCSNAGTATVTQTGTAGGTYSSTAGLVINAATGAVTLGTSAPGTYTVTYTIAAAGGCATYTTTTTITITVLPAATIAYAGSPYCSNAGTATVTRTGTAGGTYSSTAGLVINGATGDVNLGTSTAGTYTVTYTLAAGGGCPVVTATTTITITTLPAATISYAGNPYCQNAGTATVTRTGTAGGTYSAAPAGLTINAATGTVTLGTSTPGTYTVSYTLAAASGCPAVVATATITVSSLSTDPTSATASATTLCGTGTVTLSVTGGSLGTGATWKWYSGSCGGTLVGTGATLNVTVSATTTYFVRAEGTCNTSLCASVTVTVNVQPAITLTATSPTSLRPFQTSTLTATVTPADPTNTTVWYRNGIVIPGATGLTRVVGVDALGLYTVRTTTTAGCTALSNTVLIKDTANSRMFITPNPNNGQFKVRYYSSAQQLGFLRHLVMYSESGQLVYDHTFTITAPYSSMDIDARNLAKGFYDVMVTDAFGNEVLARGKVVIQ